MLVVLRQGSFVDEQTSGCGAVAMAVAVPGGTSSIAP